MSKPKIKHRTGAATTINPDDVRMHRVIVAGVAVALLAAILTSWNGLVYVGAQQLLPWELRWVTPLMIDVPLIVLTLARGALAKRGIKTKGLFVGIIGLTVFSSIANLLHSVAVGGVATIPAVLGATTNGLAPWLILAMTEALWLVVTRQPRPARARTKPAPAKRATRPATVRPTPAPQLFEAEPERDPLGALRESAA